MVKKAPVIVEDLDAAIVTSRRTESTAISHEDVTARILGNRVR